MRLFFVRYSSLSLSTTIFTLSLFLYFLSLSPFHYFSHTSRFLSLYHSTSSLAHYPAARCNRFENPTTHALRVVAAACCTSSSSSCLPSLFSQCHHCGGTGSCLRGHGPRACTQDRQVVLALSRSGNSADGISRGDAYDVPQGVKRLH